MSLNRDNLPPILALLVTIFMFVVIIVLIVHPTQNTESLVRDVIMIIAGGFNTIVGFYFGSSLGSAKKTEILDKGGNGGNTP